MYRYPLSYFCADRKCKCIYFTVHNQQYQTNGFYYARMGFCNGCYRSPSIYHRKKKWRFTIFNLYIFKKNRINAGFRRYQRYFSGNRFRSSAPSQSEQVVANICRLGTGVPLLAVILEIIGITFIWNLSKKNGKNTKSAAKTQYELIFPYYNSWTTVADRM